MSVHNLTYLKSINVDYIEELYDRYLETPDSIDPTWKTFFDGLNLGTITALSLDSDSEVASDVNWENEIKVYQLIQAYREKGRLCADLNPLKAPLSSHPALDLARYGLQPSQLTETFRVGAQIGLPGAQLSEIISRLKKIYCGTISAEIAVIGASEERNFIQSRIEGIAGQPSLDPETKKYILKRLSASEGWEKFLHTRYVAKKRFSIEGVEALIPALDAIMEKGAELGAEGFVMGMAHRGRLNVLINTFGKKPEYLLSEFEDNYERNPETGDGDVKYHKGYSSHFTTRSGKEVEIDLAFNPSHLEFVNPVVQGMARAKQDRASGNFVPVIMHGDAAFAGQGVVYETLTLSNIKAYEVGGTIHIITNNQIGFTTDVEDARSTTFASDLARMLEVPIVHVNGDDPEAVWFVSQLAMEYRNQFKKDFFIDLIGYRRYGHNEGDEPAFTQPIMYKSISAHPTPRAVYATKLAETGVVDAATSQAWFDGELEKLTAAQTKMRNEKILPKIYTLEGKWTGLKRGTLDDFFSPVTTRVSRAELTSVSEKINKFPSGFKLHPKLARVFEPRLKAIQDGKDIDWANGETLAYATLLNEGTSVRFSGQDVERGTFTHRHAVLHDSETGEEYKPLDHLGPKQGQFRIYNSNLTETGAMGFEYGYSLTDPNALTIWEGQFGDFANGAQVIIDQFLAASESKWSRMSGLTLLLPHGYEGQGPEHSSARYERFLQLAAQGNMSVCNLTTSAQIFHALRRQVKWKMRKPLIIMSPKSLLRQAYSKIEEFTDQDFQEVIADPVVASGAKTVLLCSGKIYYELVAEREAKGRKDLAIVRVEQVYPWPEVRLAPILKKHPGAKIYWVQEEPRNMGAWSFVFNTWMGGLDDSGARMGVGKIEYIGRNARSSPAVGSEKIHKLEQKEILERGIQS